MRVDGFGVLFLMIGLVWFGFGFLTYRYNSPHSVFTVF